MSQGLTYSFAEELFQGVHDFDTDVFKIALYTTLLDQTTTAYSATNEVSGGSYVAGGETATLTLTRTDNVVTLELAEIDISTPQTMQSYLLYNSSKANRSVLVAPKSGPNTPGTLTIIWTQPIIRMTV